MTKAVVTCNLYKREESPSVNSKKLGHFISGDEVEILDVVIGDPYQGISTWYKLSNGIYAWSGGVSMDLEEPLLKKKIELDRQPLKKLPSPSGQFDLFKNLILNNTSLPGDGTNVKIAVLDTGIDVQHPSLKNRIIGKQENFQSNSGPHPHGTQVAGILVANDDRLKGVSTGAKLYDLRVSDDDNYSNEDAINKALKAIESKRITCHIINMSIEISKSAVSPLQKIVAKLISENIIIVVAGNEGQIPNFISKLLNVISVRTFVRSEFENLKSNGIGLSYSIAFLNENIATPALYPHHANFRDSSAYTAVVSGLIARYISGLSTKPSNMLIAVNKFLQEYSFPIKQEISPLPFKMYK